MDNKMKKNIMIVIMVIVILLLIAYFVFFKLGDYFAASDYYGMQISEELVSKTAETGNTSDISNVIITNEGIKVNISQKVSEEKLVGKYTVSDMGISSQAGKSTISFKVSNKSDEALKDKEYKIKFLDSTSKEIASVSGVIGSLNAGEDSYFNVYFDKDISNAYNYSFKF